LSDYSEILMFSESMNKENGDNRDALALLGLKQKGRPS
jgi:hypothetical protein